VIVVDANVLVYALVGGPASAAVDRLHAREPIWIAPPLWRSEVCNALLQHVRHAGLPRAAALTAMADAEQLVHETIPVDPRQVLRLAAGSRCSAYDCEYVTLALEAGVPLVTADRKLAEAFPDVCVLLPG